jgi:hypothetical protein
VGDNQHEQRFVDDMIPSFLHIAHLSQRHEPKEHPAECHEDWRGNLPDLYTQGDRLPCPGLYKVCAAKVSQAHKQHGGSPGCIEPCQPD